MQVNQKSVISNLIWRFMERCGAKGIQFIVSIVLARILTPSDYGVVGLITVFISILTVFVQSGLGQALVQQKQADENDFSIVLWFSLVFSLILYVLLYFCAPLISSFYKMPILVPIVRVLGIVLIINAVGSVQQAYIQKNLLFKKFFCVTIIGTITSAVISLIAAYNGFGVWALVIQQITLQAINVIVFFLFIKWKPKLVFSFLKIKDLFSYGWKLLCSALLDTVYNNIYSLIIGKYYSSSDLGYYNRGKQFPVLIIENINSAIDSVLFPVMSNVQDEKENLKSLTRRSIITSTFLIFPAMAGLAAIAKPLTILVLTEKWLPAVPFIQFCCFSYAFWPIHTANLQAIKAVGRSDVFLRLEIVKKIVGVMILVATIPFGLYVMMIGRCVSTLTSSFINAFPNKKLLGYSYIQQIRDILPSFMISLLMITVLIFINFISINPVLQIVIQIILGVLIYFGLSKLFKLECLEYILGIIKKLRKG